MGNYYEFGTRSPFGCTVGDRIYLIRMGDDPDPISSGSEGTVTGFCDTRGLKRIFVAWDSGRGLSLIPGKDKFVVVDAYYNAEEELTWRT